MYERPFFRAEQADLLRDLHDLPRNSAVRKINELVKRARSAWRRGGRRPPRVL